MGFIKIVWIVSLLGFLAMLLSTYVFLPENVSLFFDTTGAVTYVVSRTQYFYLAFGVFIFINVLIVLLGKAMVYASPNWIWLPHKKYWFQDNYRRKKFYKRYQAWLKGLAVCINSFFTLMLMGLLKLNDPSTRSNTDWVYYLILVLTIAWLIAYYFIFNSANDEE